MPFFTIFTFLFLSQKKRWLFLQDTIYIDEYGDDFWDKASQSFSQNNENNNENINENNKGLLHVYFQVFCYVFVCGKIV